MPKTKLSAKEELDLEFAFKQLRRMRIGEWTIETSNAKIVRAASSLYEVEKGVDKVPVSPRPRRPRPRPSELRTESTGRAPRRTPI